MLTFFRNIRKKLADDNKPLKYMRYAVGEIVLVVIGILIALQINNWNEWRKDRQTEKVILQALIENLERNMEMLESDRELLALHNKSAEIVLAVLDNKLPYTDSLSRHFHRARVPKLELSLSASGYEQLKNKGFDIIIKDRIREKVIQYFESYFPKWFASYSNVNSQYESFIDHHVPLFYYKNQSLTPIDIQSLYTDQYFIGWIRAYMEGRNTIMQQENVLMEETQRILEFLKDEMSGN